MPPKPAGPVVGTGSEAGEKKTTARLTSKLTSRLKTARVQLPAKKGAGAPPVAKPSSTVPGAKPVVAKPSAAPVATRTVSTTPSAVGGAPVIPAIFLVASLAWCGFAAFSYFTA